MYLVMGKFTMEILKIFAAFSEYMNFVNDTEFKFSALKQNKSMASDFFYGTFCNLNTDAIKLLKVLGLAIRAIFQSSCAVA